MFADRLLSDGTMPPKPDLGSHSLIHFLDKFVYKNAKLAPGGPKGSSIMQPLAGSTTNASILVSSRSSKGLENVNSEAFWRKKAEDVDVDEVFFHRYFSQIKKADKASKKKDKKKDGESDEENEDDEIWQALVNSRPEIDGPDEDDESDLEMLDLDDSEASSVASDAEVDVDFGNSDEEAGDSEDGGANIWEDEDEEMVDAAEDDEDMDALFKNELVKNAPVVEESAENLSGRKKKKKMKGLPTFASVDDYAELLARDEDEDIG